jgi:hypothetical protein
MMMQTEITPLEAQRKKRIAEDEQALMVAEAQLEKMLPIPVGYHLMVVMPEVKDTFNVPTLPKPKLHSATTLSCLW